MLKNCVIPRPTLLFLSALCLLQAQSKPDVSFEAAVVKAAPEWRMEHNKMVPIPSFVGGPGSGSPNRLKARNQTLSDLVRRAYDVQPYQLVGPSWLVNERWLMAQKFDIDATIPADATKPEFSQMLRRLLEESFSAKAHKEERTLSRYLLVVGREGVKFQTEPGERKPSEVPGANGAGVVPSDYSGPLVRALPHHGLHVEFIRFSMPDFADWLSNNLKLQVIDQTGLTGNYSFTLEFATDLPTSDDAGNEMPSLIPAVQSTLGCKLNPDKGPVTVLVIDHIEQMPKSN